MLYRIELHTGLACGSRWYKNKRQWSKSSLCLNQLQWPSLHVRWKYLLFANYMIFYMHGRLSISFHQYSKSRTHSHPLTINLKQSSINPFRYSFFVNTPFLWNSTLASILEISQSRLFHSALSRFLFVVHINFVVVIIVIV